MKKVVLKSITQRNFRGEKERTTVFGPETTIAGENGTGKSRHFDAFVWLLFGKDSKERKDYNIKTTVDGKPVERMDTEVSGVLELWDTGDSGDNCETINLRRVFKEKWVKPRGQIEERFDGHETEFFWNDVPLRAGEYQARINGIVDDSVFKMITRPSFFTGMKWQEQREVLFQLAGTITDSEIAAQKPEYAALLDKISGKSMTDFKREIAARKRKLKDELETIQPRIDQTHKLMPQSIDFAELERYIVAWEKELENAEYAINDEAAALNQKNEARLAKQSQINELKQKQQKVLFQAQNKAREDFHAANAEKREVECGVSMAQSNIKTIQGAIDSNMGYFRELEKNLEQKQEETDNLRVNWHEENGKEYAEEETCLVCPVFRIACADNNALDLHAENKGKARKAFLELKRKKLAEITQKGKNLNIEIGDLNKRLDKLAEKDEELRARLAAEKQTFERLQTKLSEMPTLDEKGVVADDLPEYVSLSEKITELEKAVLGDNGNGGDTAELQAKLQSLKKDIVAKLDAAKGDLKNRDLIAKYQKEIKELEEKGKQVAQQIADVEREEFTIQNFTKARIDECERRINGLFTMVTFKLFEYTIDGNEVETCVPLVNGVPFGTANSAGQVNAGLDIINALVRFHGVSAPIFIDGRESVNRLIPTESQIVNLVVTNDKELVVR